MINLLPTGYAQDIHYGRQNTVLRKWLFGMAGAILGLVVIFAGGWLYINQQAKTLQANINATQTELTAENLPQVQANAKEITGDIKVINQVLSTEINFSGLIQAIGSDMPPGTILGAISLSKTTGALDLSANALDYPSAAQIAVNLSNSQNDLFSKVDIESINCQSNATSAYKCGVSMRALFANDAKTKFLSVPQDDK